MAQHIFRQVWNALSHLNPSDVRSLADEPVHIGLHATSAEAYDEMEEFLCPSYLSRERRIETFSFIHRAGEEGAPSQFDIEIYEKGMPRPKGAFSFHPADPGRTVEEILERNEGLGLPIARNFAPFRAPVSDRIVHQVSRENALFALATAIPDIMPSLASLPWAVGQFASDTAFLTVNQVRMAFLLAAASDRAVGYREQRGEIGSIVAGAFGWRAIARELAGKIPLGGGLIPKAAIAYAGTMVAGRVLERLYREGYSLTREQRREAYVGAFEKGKRVAAQLLEGFKRVSA